MRIVIRYRASSVVPGNMYAIPAHTRLNFISHLEMQLPKARIII